LAEADFQIGEDSYSNKFENSAVRVEEANKADFNYDDEYEDVKLSNCHRELAYYEHQLE
jgi:hypothetical protein